jgi:hypothetical protein
MTTSTSLKFSVPRLALAFVIAGVSDVIGAFASLAPPIGWAVDVVTAALLFVVLGWQWLLLPGLVLEAIPGSTRQLTARSGDQNDAVTVALNGDVSAIELYKGEITISGD